MSNEERKAFELAVENHERAMARVADLEREVAALAQSERVPDELAAKAADAIDCCESAIKHLLHNIKSSGKRIDLGLAPSSADEALRRVNQYRNAAAPSPSKQGGV